MCMCIVCAAATAAIYSNSTSSSFQIVFSISTNNGQWQTVRIKAFNLTWKTNEHWKYICRILKSNPHVCMYVCLCWVCVRAWHEWKKIYDQHVPLYGCVWLLCSAFRQTVDMERRLNDILVWTECRSHCAVNRQHETIEDRERLTKGKRDANTHMRW